MKRENKIKKKNREKMMRWMKGWTSDGDKSSEFEAVDVSSVDGGSHYSVSNGLLPSLGSRSNRRIILRPYIISPLDPNYRWWDTFLVLLVFYTSWVSPFEFGFLKKPIRALAFTDNMVNGFFAIDIVLTFFVAYLDQHTFLLVDEPNKIARRYLSTWFFFDVVSTIPYELVEKIIPDTIQGYGLFSMLRLWRLRRVSKMFSRLEKDRNISYSLVRCAKLIYATVFAVHMAACFMYNIADHYPDPKNTWIGSIIDDFHHVNIWRQYVTSVYWSITTLTTTGYGDIHPVNTREMIFDTFYMLFNLGMSAYVLGNMTSLVVHGTSRTRKYRDTIQAVSDFAVRNRLPVRLQDQMLAHLCLKYRTDSEGLQQQEIIEALPKAIKSSISHYLFYSLLDRVYLFSGVSNDLLFQLVSEMKAEYFPPKEDVILQNEAPTDLYVLVSGAVEFIIQKNGAEHVVRDAQAGEVCGEIGVLCYRPQLFTIRTKRLCQLLRLNRTALLNLVQANVGDGAIIMNNLLGHLKGKDDPLMQSVLRDVENMLAHGRMDLPLSLSFAAARGDEPLLQHLLRRGTDPNEADVNGRTALHVSAASGDESCAACLLSFGADPNAKDSEGNVPLWEAIVGRHESMSKLLIKHGATLDVNNVPQYACFAVEQDNVDLLKDIVQYGGDVRLAKSNGTTPLHQAVTAGNVTMTQFLLKQGADINKADMQGWTPRDMAEFHKFEEIKALFSSKEETSGSFASTPSNNSAGAIGSVRRVRTDSSDTPPRVREVSWFDRQRRRRVNTYQNSLFGVMSAATSRGEIPESSAVVHSPFAGSQVARVILKCPEKGDTEKLVILPETIQELLELGSQKFDCTCTNVLSANGAEIDEIEVIRDGDTLQLICQDENNKSE